MRGFGAVVGFVLDGSGVAVGLGGSSARAWGFRRGWLWGNGLFGDFSVFYFLFFYFSGGFWLGLGIVFELSVWMFAVDS
jgi:hypothetical protein